MRKTVTFILPTVNVSGSEIELIPDGQGLVCGLGEKSSFKKGEEQMMDGRRRRKKKQIEEETVC